MYRIEKSCQQPQEHSSVPTPFAKRECVYLRQNDHHENCDEIAAFNAPSIAVWPSLFGWKGRPTLPKSATVDISPKSKVVLFGGLQEAVKSGSQVKVWFKPLLVKGLKVNNQAFKRWARWLAAVSQKRWSSKASSMSTKMTLESVMEAFHRALTLVTRSLMAVRREVVKKGQVTVEHRMAKV